MVDPEMTRNVLLNLMANAITTVHGAEARKEISGIVEAPVHLFLFVKVRENWADDPERYREMGIEFPKG